MDLNKLKITTQPQHNQKTTTISYKTNKKRKNYYYYLLLSLNFYYKTVKQFMFYSLLFFSCFFFFDHINNIFTFFVFHTAIYFIVSVRGITNANRNNSGNIIQMFFVVFM
jgi:hypothetical protein